MQSTGEERTGAGETALFFCAYRFVCDKTPRVLAGECGAKVGGIMQNRVVFRAEKTKNLGLVCCFALATCKIKTRHKAAIFAYDWKGAA